MRRDCPRQTVVPYQLGNARRNGWPDGSGLERAPDACGASSKPDQVGSELSPHANFIFCFARRLVPYFSSRAFVPLFAAATIGRFCPGIAQVAEVVGVQVLASMPRWALSNPAVVLLGLLAASEVVASKVPEVREASRWRTQLSRPWRRVFIASCSFEAIR